MAYLYLSQSLGFSEYHKVESFLSLGRGPKNQLQLNDPHVSNYHARIERSSKGEFILRDTGSQNGTYLNGSRIKEAELNDNDLITVGSQKLTWMLNKVTEQDLKEALTEESLFKVRLEVEFDDFEQVVFYRRGESQLSETITSLWGLRKQTINFTNYDRVAVYITFKDKAYFAQKKKQPFGYEPSSTIIKLFQNVPKADLEMLFPNSEVRMRPIDKAIIGVSAMVGGTVVLVTKLGASLLILWALIAFWLGWRSESVAMTQQHFISLGLGIAIFSGFVFKEWSKFKNRKIKFMKALSDNLYFKSLDNNAGVFHTLIDAAEEEDFKEVLLAYTFLLNSEEGLSKSALDKKIEAWFMSKYNCHLDFEISDAIEKLERMQLVTVKGDIYQAISLAQAKQHLDKRWDSLFDYNQ